MNYPHIVGNWDKFPAKTIKKTGLSGTTTQEHCVASGVMAQCFYDILPERLRNLMPSRSLVGLIVGGHDVGKISPYYLSKYFHDFNNVYLPNLKSIISTLGEIEHTEVGEISHNETSAGRLSSIQGTVAETHHGFKNSKKKLIRDGHFSIGDKDFQQERNNLKEYLEKYFNAFYKDARLIKNRSQEKLMCGIASVSDWLVSDENNFPPDQKLDLDYIELSKKCNQILEKTGIFKLPVNSGLEFKDIFEGKNPFNSQKRFYENIDKPGLYILEAPMGGGKTEAALYATYKLMEKGYHNGFYFALPTRLTSDKIHERVENFIDKILNHKEKCKKAKLAHGLAWLSEFDEGKIGTCGQEEEEDPNRKEKIASWFNPTKRALLYNYSVGTVDQALMMITNSKHNFVREFGLAGKVVILDEVHTYDMYTGSLIDVLVDRLLKNGCTVIILSATLSNARRKELLGFDINNQPPLEINQFDTVYPLMSIKPENEKVTCESFSDGVSKKYNVRIEDWNLEQMAEQAVSKMNAGLCVVAICNTVDRAQELYDLVCEKSNYGSDIGLLHSRFPFNRRQEIEKEWMMKLGKNAGELNKDGSKNLERPKGCVLIATQIVEQSVDIDADWMITEICPIDMFLQRVGRLWRHQRNYRTGIGEVVVISGNPLLVNSKGEKIDKLGKKTCRIYSPYVLIRTYEILSTKKIINLPEDIRFLIEETYSSNYFNNAIMNEFFQDLKNDNDKKKNKADQAKSRDLPCYDDDQDPTRYSSCPSMSVLLIKSLKETAYNTVEIELIEKDQTGKHIKFVVNGDDKLDYAIARKLHNQTFSVLSFLLSKSGQECGSGCEALKKYFYIVPCILTLDGLNVSKLEGDLPCELKYTENKGLFTTRIDDLYSGIL